MFDFIYICLLIVYYIYNICIIFINIVKEKKKKQQKVEHVPFGTKSVKYLFVFYILKFLENHASSYFFSLLFSYHPSSSLSLSLQPPFNFFSYSSSKFIKFPFKIFKFLIPIKVELCLSLRRDQVGGS